MVNVNFVENYIKNISSIILNLNRQLLKNLTGYILDEFYIIYSQK